MSARRVASHLVTAVAILMMVGSGIWIMAAKMSEKFEELIPGGFILWAGIALARFGRRLRARSVDEVLASDPRRHVVYLRSFVADAAASRAASD